MKEETAGRSCAEGGEGVRILIVGGGIAGVSAAEGARKTSPAAKITLATGESHLPYYRINLTRYLAGETDQAQLPLHPEEWYGNNGIELMRGSRLAGIDIDSSLARFEGEGDVAWDRLILATGSRPLVPPVPGTGLDGVTVLRTMDDAEMLIERCAICSECVVIGGGLLGLETAGALSARGIEVTLLEMSGRLLPRQLNEEASRILERHLASLGITLIENALTRRLEGDERVSAVVLEDGRRIPADFVVIATGVRPNADIARTAGLEVDQGIIVDDRMQTSIPGIYAAGDVAEHRGVNYGTWGPARSQGTTAGINAAGGKVEFAGIPPSSMLKVLGLDMFSIGSAGAKDAGQIEISGASGRSYRYFLFEDGRLAGSILLGDTTLSTRIKAAMEKGVDFSGLLSRGATPEDIAAAL